MKRTEIESLAFRLPRPTSTCFWPSASFVALPVISFLSKNGTINESVRLEG
jgi:hypothetical protein